MISYKFRKIWYKYFIFRWCFSPTHTHTHTHTRTFKISSVIFILLLCIHSMSQGCANYYYYYVSNFISSQLTLQMVYPSDLYYIIWGILTVFCKSNCGTWKVDSIYISKYTSKDLFCSFVHYWTLLHRCQHDHDMFLLKIWFPIFIVMYNYDKRIRSLSEMKIFKLRLI